MGSISHKARMVPVRFDKEAPKGKMSAIKYEWIASVSFESKTTEEAIIHSWMKGEVDLLLDYEAIENLNGLYGE